MKENRALLLEHFARRLFSLTPASVLDVGCGQGRLLELCREAGIRCEGIDGDAANVDACVRRDLPVRRGDAAALPFEDSSFAWVALRHVAHHLEHPSAALAEAWRVAAVGLLVAEPWYDQAFESQRLGLRADRLFKRFDRARGMFHADALGSEELVRLLPGEAVDVALETYLEPRLCTAADFAAQAELSLGGLEPEPELARERALLAERAAAGEITLGGTLILRVLKGQRSLLEKGTS